MSEDGEELYLCPRCQCCSMVHHECDECGGDGFTEDEDWQFKDSVTTCSICAGTGGWTVCGGACDPHGIHDRQPEAREDMRESNP